MDTIWTLPSSINPENISVDETPIPKTTRHNILYKYKNGEVKPLLLTVPLDRKAFLTVGPPKKKPFKDDTGNMITPLRHSCSISLEGTNDEHVNFYNSLMKISETVSSVLSRECVLPTIFYGETCFIFASLIENKDGVIFTKFYNEDRYYEWNECGRFIGRPCISFSINKKNGKIIPQLMEAYVNEKISIQKLATLM